MFGKKSMSASGQFIMARGKSTGNLKDVEKARPKAQPPKKTDKVTAPVLGNDTDRGRTKLGAIGKLGRELK